MERAKSILETIRDVIYIGVHYIVFYGRKYPLAPALYLVFFVWFFFLRKPALPPPAPLSSSTSPTFTPISNPNPYSSAPAPAPAPVITTARVSAFRNDNKIILRWNRPVTGQDIFIDGNKIKASCQPTECVTTISGQVNLIHTRWNESNQSFEKSFQF